MLESHTSTRQPRLKGPIPHNELLVPAATLFTGTLETRKDSLKGLNITSLFFPSYYSDMYVPNFTVLLNPISL